jgi:hypothetical protein
MRHLARGPERSSGIDGKSNAARRRRAMLHLLSTLTEAPA